MASATEKEITAFGQSALTLDGDLREFNRLSGQIEELEIDSDHGLERAKQLLGRFSECGLRISDGIQTLSRTLDEARLTAEKAAESVGARAALVQKRQEEFDRLTARFQALGANVRDATTTAADILKLPKEDKALVTENLNSLDSRLATLMEEAGNIRIDAHQANMKHLEQNAESLGQSLNSVRRKLGSVAIA